MTILTLMKELKALLWWKLEPDSSKFFLSIRSKISWMRSWATLQVSRVESNKSQIVKILNPYSTLTGVRT